MKFRLLGQDVAISEAAESYNTYRKLFIGQAKTAANQFFDMYERNQSLEDVVRKHRIKLQRVLRRRSSCVFRYWSTTVFIPLTANNSPAHIGLIWIDGRKRMRRSATSMTALFLSRRSWISIVLRAGRIAAAGSAEVSASAVH